MLYNGSIIAVQFSLSGSDTVKKDSNVPILTHDLFRGGLPYPGGMYDAHLGTTDHSYRCQSCHNGKKQCVGHEGSIALKYPVWSPMALKEGKKWLKLICFVCGHPVIESSVHAKVSPMTRLDAASKSAKNAKEKKCPHCEREGKISIHPMVKKDPAEITSLIAEVYEDKKLLDRYTIYPHMAAEILSRISDETVIGLGKSPLSHPRNFVLTHIKVPSVSIRPDVKKIGGGRASNDDITTMLQVIIKKNETMPPMVPGRVVDAKTAKLIFELNNTYYDLIRASEEGSSNSFAKRLKGKQGRFRKNALGKRVRVTCRSTIVGDVSIRVDEVGMPLSFARTVQIEETVQAYNKKRLLEFVYNGTKKYPGASKIIKKSSGVEYNINPNSEIDLDYGDTVLRDLIDGDVANFNRQPSLSISSIACHYIKVLVDSDIKSISLNPIACSLYNADFDGDQMNFIVSAGVAARSEISQLSSVDNFLISHTTGNPSLGQIQDGVVGLFELTRSNVRLDKYHAMLVFRDNTWLPDFTDATIMSGRDCISMLLADTPITFTRVPTWYQPNLAPYINYDPDEIKVVIDHGKMLSGVLDKKSIGPDANGGVYHIIANEYGAKKCLDVMFNMQQMAVQHTMQLGFTIGVMDVLVSPETKIELDRIGSDIIAKSHLVTERLNNGEIIPPIGKTVEEFYEEMQINTLSVFDDFTKPILDHVDPSTNNLFKLVMSGSKAKLENIYNMMSSNGQKLINNERVRYKFGFKRTLAYFQRFDTSPESRGYIANSYLAGVNSCEYIFNSMDARYALIAKALSTSIAGEQNRDSIKNLESTIINNLRMCMKDRNVTGFVYGEDFLDPRKLEVVKFPTVMITDAAFEATYSDGRYPAYTAALKRDRDEYRNNFLACERMNIKESISDERRMPLSVDKIITDITKEHASGLGQEPPTPEELEKMVGHIEALCASIPYVLVNAVQEEQGTPIPEYIRRAAWLLTMMIRVSLHPRKLEAIKMTLPLLKIITDRIRSKYALALIDPGTPVGIIAAQSFSEPLTQYMLDAHHRSATGGTSKQGMIRTKEVLSAKPVDMLSSPSMLLSILPACAHDKAKVQEIAHHVEMLRFGQFVVDWQIFFEKYGHPVHSRYAHEGALIAEFNKLNPLLRPPADLIKWCIRFAIDKTTLIFKNIALEAVITKLRELYPELYIMYTPENAPQIIVRVYMKNALFKALVGLSEVKKIKELLVNCVVRGVNGISNANVTPMIRSRVNDAGGIERIENLWGITTTGTNMSGVFSLGMIDRLKTQTDAIQEVASMLGIEAARQKIVCEMRNIVEKCNLRHYYIYADEMTYTGKVTSIKSSGLKSREASNVLLRAGFTSPIGVLEEAAANTMKDHVTGITAPLLMGSVPKIGTLYNKFYMDEDFVKKNVKRPDDLVAALLS